MHGLVVYNRACFCFQGSWDYAKRAAGWCRTHGIQVMMDLHGAPGSQVDIS